jgi:cytidylate kinase-like protein
MADFADGEAAMDCTVVTVARTLGAHGEEVARRVADKLGFQYVDDEIITWAAQQAGVSPESVSEAERTPPLMARILASLAVAPIEPGAYTAPELMPLPDYSSQAYRNLIAQVIRDRAAKGKAVIVAHGAAIPLAGTAGLVRAFVTASPETRIKRLAAQGSVSERDAKRAVENSDRERHEFFRRFYNLHEELPTHYDVVVSMDVLSPDEAAAVVLRAAGA